MFEPAVLKADLLDHALSKRAVLRRTSAKRALLSLALVLCALPAVAGSPPVVDAATRKAVLSELAAQLQRHYVFPDVAESLATQLAARDAAGAYADASDARRFAELLSQDLRRLGKDAHFNVQYDPQFRAPPEGTPPAPDAADVERARTELAQRGYGIGSVSRLPGNVGYLELRAFGPTELVGDAITAAMTLLQGSDGMILDLRRNGGGEPQTVAHLMSHFFPMGDQRHLNDLYSRADNRTHQYWTDITVAPRYTKPVYVLTSARTFSGGEECAYDFQTQKRATLVGETTGGGANPGDVYAVGKGYVAFIPNGRAINPVTGGNWEHTGVTPDIAVPAADAQKVAHAALLRERLKLMPAGEDRTALQETLRKVEAGVVDAPVYTLRR